MGQMDEEINSMLKSYTLQESPGFSAAVILGDETIYKEGFGLANLDYSIPNTDSTRFDIASAAKQFTASAIWVLHEKGKLSLDDSIKTYLPEFPSYSEPVRVRHLLNHTSGIRNYHTIMHLSGFEYELDYYDLNDVLELACRQKSLNNQPGEVVAYSNTNYSLLAIIVERVSGQDLNSFLKQHIFHPLEMKNTDFRTAMGEPMKNKAIGYRPTQSGFNYDPDNQLSYGAGSAYSSVNDMCKWMRMLNEENSAFTSLAKFLKTPERLPDGKKAGYARGVMIDTYKGFDLFSHSGMGTGNRSQMIVVPEKQIGVVILTNSGAIDATAIAYKILDTTLPKTKEVVSETAAVEYRAEQDLATFEGEFRENNSDMTMTVFVENDTLKAIGSFGRTPSALIPSEHMVFHRLGRESVKYDFTQNPKYDLAISFGGTPFYFSRVKLVSADSIDVSAYEGSYFSDELQVTYNFDVSGEGLILSYAGKEDISLHPLQKDEFGNHDRTLFAFTRNNHDQVVGLKLSCDGNVQDIKFAKAEPND